MMNDKIGLRFKGHVKITNFDTGEILFDGFNAIHHENMSEALAMSLSNRTNGHIHEMVFGNGASTTSGTGAISYFLPNVTGQDAQLYNQTYRKVVDDNSQANVDVANNNMTVSHTQNTTYSDIIVKCMLDYNEPSNQEAFDDAPNVDGDYIFDELGLKVYDQLSGNGKLISHVVFHPVQKSLNRRIAIEYTIRIILS